RFPYLAELDGAVPDELVGDVTGKLHYVSEALADFEFGPGRDRVHFALRQGADDEAALVADRIVEVARKICSGYRGGEARVLVTRPVKAGGYVGDPNEALERQGD